MRVLTVTNLYPNPYEPTRATFNRQQLRALHELHPVRVISPISFLDESIARLKRRKAKMHHRRVILDRMTIAHPRYFYTPKLLRSHYGSFYRRSIRRAFTEALNEFHPDLIFAPWAYPDGWAAVKLAHENNLPAVIKVHGCDVLVEGKGLKHYRGRYAPTVEALKEADAIVAVSQHLADACVDLGVEPERIRVVYDGIDSSLFRPGPRHLERTHDLILDTPDPIILFVGQLVPVKGVDVLIDACAKLQSMSFRCLIIGDGPLRQELQDQINRLNLQSKVKLLGPKPHDQLRHFFRGSTVFVLPSHSEGVPCVLLESAGCGLPFVASRVGGIPEIAHLIESRLVAPNNPDQLADAIANLVFYQLSHPNAPAPTMRTHADAAREIATLFDELTEPPDYTRPLDDRPRIRPKVQSY